MSVISTARRVAITDTELLEALQACRPAPPYRAQRLRFPALIERAFAAASAFAASQPMFHCAYSVKTNPNPEVLAAARAAGLGAEVISPHEMEAAQRCGFSPGEVVYNGPFPARYCAQAPGLIFADSPEAFVANRRRFPQTRNGLRLRPVGVASRFGVPAEQAGEIVELLRSKRVDVWHASLHVRPQDYGAHTWRSLVESALTSVREVERASGAAVETFDVGGGKRPHEFDAAIAAGDFEWLQERVAALLPNVRELYCEPGQALVTSYEAFVAPVLEVRGTAGAMREIVIEAGYPDVPQMHAFPHRLFALRNGVARAIGKGAARILGRTCLEYDVIAEDVDLEGCDAGCAILIADTGAYDASMRFTFARGA